MGALGADPPPSTAPPAAQPTPPESTAQPSAEAAAAGSDVSEASALTAAERAPGTGASTGRVSPSTECWSEEDFQTPVEEQHGPLAGREGSAGGGGWAPDPHPAAAQEDPAATASAPQPPQEPAAGRGPSAPPPLPPPRPCLTPPPQRRHSSPAGDSAGSGARPATLLARCWQPSVRRFDPSALLPRDYSPPATGARALRRRHSSPQCRGAVGGWVDPTASPLPPASYPSGASRRSAPSPGPPDRCTPPRPRPAAPFARLPPPGAPVGAAVRAAVGVYMRPCSRGRPAASPQGPRASPPARPAHPLGDAQRCHPGPPRAPASPEPPERGRGAPAHAWPPRGAAPHGGAASPAEPPERRPRPGAPRSRAGTPFRPRRAPPPAASGSMSCRGSARVPAAAAPVRCMHPALQWGELSVRSQRLGGVSGAGEVGWRLSLRGGAQRSSTAAGGPLTAAAAADTRKRRAQLLGWRWGPDPRALSLSPSTAASPWRAAFPEAPGLRRVPGVLQLIAAEEPHASSNVFELSDEAGETVWHSAAPDGRRFTLFDEEGVWMVRRAGADRASSPFSAASSCDSDSGAALLWSDPHRGRMPDDPALRWWRREHGAAVAAGVMLRTLSVSPLPLRGRQCF
eukprot:TRINITY_DN9910_c0_g2_i1.p1 TRINITY_DN9910_c0_g2~~TRINITY_DN9910_c0_g2_i1.p1  ORF type:complete len:654 (+),score=114.60 TRINITY_DN9910_c0_g2_i1:84-1964(+)